VLQHLKGTTVLAVSNVAAARYVVRLQVATHAVEGKGVVIPLPTPFAVERLAVLMEQRATAIQLVSSKRRSYQTFATVYDTNRPVL
jgi:hypothetical protein